MEVWIYRSTLSSPRHYLEVLGKLHTPAALSPGKQPPPPPVPTVYETQAEEENGYAIISSIIPVFPGGSEENHGECHNRPSPDRGLNTGPTEYGEGVVTIVNSEAPGQQMKDMTAQE
jgi:hypothetical protein